MMTATDELRRLLDERGVEYFTDDDERAYDEPARTTWDFVLCGYEMTVTATELVDIEGKTYLEMDFYYAFTPDQAIAATLGGDEPPYHELLRCLKNDWYISASWDGLRKFWCIELTEEGVRMRDAAHGMLTAEQVREAWCRNLKRDCLYDPPTPDWQAIADELNAAIGGGECEMETDWDYLHDGIPDAPEDTWAYKCSVCGWSFRYDRGIKPKHCPNCGKAVKR